MRCFLIVVLLALLTGCASNEAPAIPEYTVEVVLEPEPHLSANAEIADFDGDGLNDVALAVGRHWPGNNLILFGDGMGGFVRTDTLSNPGDRTYSMSAADMDGDGDLDLVVSNDRPDVNYVLLNDGSGAFLDRIDFGDPEWPTRNSTVADLNGDGYPDVVVANRSSDPRSAADRPDGPAGGNNYVCLNNASQPLTLDCQALPSGSATTITVADMDNDGFPDLIAPFRDGGQSHVLFGDGTGAFQRYVAFGPGDAVYRSAMDVDINDDDLLDLVAISDAARSTWVFRQLPDGTFDAGFRLDDGEMIPYALDIADLDGDARNDILVGYRQAPSRLFFNRADSLTRVVVGDSLGAAYGFGVGDVNHDRKMDIALARSGASDILFLGN